MLSPNPGEDSIYISAPALFSLQEPIFSHGPIKRGGKDQQPCTSEQNGAEGFVVLIVLLSF